jgi:redox-sensing transcriptional repressor
MRYHKIPDETIRRLPVYLRVLLQLAEQGQGRTSSKYLAELVGVNSWQIRKDFSYFGELGKRGVGYNTVTLTGQIRKILRLDEGQKAALIGVGNLGRALLAYPGFAVYGFGIAAAFDDDPKKVGKKVNNVVIESISQLSLLKARGIHLAILAVPRDAAQKTADRLIEAGVRGILKFSPCYIDVPKKVKVITIDIAMDLARLPYYVRRA